MSFAAGFADSDELARHAGSLRRLARALVRDEAEAEDLIQETFVVALERPPKNRSALRGWLGTVARRLALDRRRASVRRHARESEVARKEGQPSHVAALEQLEASRVVLECVLALREPYRTTVSLRYWEGLEPDAIAERLGVPVKTVKTRLHRAIHELRQRLDGRFAGDRGAWFAALLPIAATGGVGIMKKMLVAAVVVVLLAAVAWRLIPWEAQRGIRSASVAAAPVLDAPPPVAASEGLAIVAAPDREAASAPAVSGNKMGALAVRLKWADGRPASDVSMDVSCTNDPAPRDEYFRGRTDSDGRVRFPALFGGKVALWVDRGARFTADVAVGTEREVEFVLPSGAAVEGRVLDTDGNPVADAEIWSETIRFSSSRFHFLRRAGRDGAFRVEGLPSDARIGARASGRTPSPILEMPDLQLGPNGNAVAVLHVGSAGGDVEGTVRDPRGLPIAGALVKIGARGGGIIELPDGTRGENPSPVPVETDAEGRFTYAGALPEGSQPVFVAARGWPRWEGAVDVSTHHANRIDVVLQDPARIEGRVVDREGHPVAGARVLAAAEWGGGWHFDEFPPPRATTASDGRFDLGWVASGEQEVHASVSTHTELGKATANVRCNSGETAHVELALDPGLTISGRIVDTERHPLVGWNVYGQPVPYGNAYPRNSKTDEQGRFVLANLDADHRYDVQTSAPKESPIPPRGERKAAAPGSTDVEIVVENARIADARVRGILRGEDGGEPAGIKLVCFPESSNSGRYVEFDPHTGAFDYGPLLAGRYDLRIMRGGQTLLRTDRFELRSGATEDVGVIQPTPAGLLEIPVAGLGTTRPPVLDREGHGTEEMVLDGDVFRSRPLEPGSWTVHLGWGGDRFLRGNQVEIKSGVTTRVELHTEQGFQLEVDCVFADADAQWTRLDSEARDEHGEVVVRNGSWFRAAMQDGKVRLFGIVLPAGRFRIDARTDSGLRGSATIEVGPGHVQGAPTVIELR